MSMKQLDTLLRFEKEKESQAAKKLQVIEQEYQENLQRLQGVGDYRLEYMKRLNTRSITGIESYTFSHYHQFIKKLDQAGEQVKIAIRQSQAMMEKCKKDWLAQRQKVKAVEHLKEQRLKKMMLIEQKKEQNMFDEIATQQYLRKQIR